jgi:hypothetical protein
VGQELKLLTRHGVCAVELCPGLGQKWDKNSLNIVKTRWFYKNAFLQNMP